MKDLQSIRLSNAINSIASNLHHSDCTCNLNGERVAFPAGYLVSLKLPEQITRQAVTFSDCLFIAKKLYRQAFNNSAYIGRWSDQNAGICFDITVHMNDLNEAIKIGEANDQLAIWDCVKNKEIRL